MTTKSLAFEITAPYRGFTVTAWYLAEPDQRVALVKIFKEGEPYREFTFPAYKIFNIAAHFEDIVNQEVDGLCDDDAEWDQAADNGATPVE